MNIIAPGDIALPEFAADLIKAIEHMRDQDLKFTRSTSGKNMKEGAYRKVIDFIGSVQFVPASK